MIIDQLSLIDGQPGQDFALFDKNKKWIYNMNRSQFLIVTKKLSRQCKQLNQLSRVKSGHNKKFKKKEKQSKTLGNYSTGHLFMTDQY